MRQYDGDGLEGAAGYPCASVAKVWRSPDFILPHLAVLLIGFTENPCNTLGCHPPAYQGGWYSPERGSRAGLWLLEVPRSVSFPDNSLVPIKIHTILPTETSGIVSICRVQCSARVLCVSATACH